MKPVDVQLEQARAEQEHSHSAAEAAPGRREGVALCLSGGGYRAALFHLGALLRLHETGWLPQVRLFSSVSGGSIVSAWLATRFMAGRSGPGESFADWCGRIDFRTEVVEPFRAFAGDDIRTWPVLSTLPFNWLWPSRRVRKLEHAYARHLGGPTLPELPEEPSFVFCASDLTFGVNWEFSRRRVGDYMAGYLREPRRIRLARAVAASSSFPPVFGPVRFPARAADFTGGKYRGKDGAQLRAHIDLTDGGVYDNLAMEPALKQYRTVLVSDAGSPFEFETRRWFLQRLLRYTNVIGNQARALRKRHFHACRAHGAFDGVIWSLIGPFGEDGGGAGERGAGYLEEFVSETIGRIRTDLDRFLDPEFEVLVNHGYFMCGHGLDSRPGTRPPEGLGEWRWPYPDMADPDRVRHALRDSHARILHTRWFRRR
ncbi:MAG: patatin-like phospholipase family protein [Luteimonas sp.]